MEWYRYTKTLCVKNNRVSVHQNAYTKPSYANKCNFSITLLDPNVDKSTNWALGRTYFGIIDSKIGSEGRFLAILVSEGHYQYTIKKIAKRWEIRELNLIQGDGSYSAQLISDRFSILGTTCPRSFNIKNKERCYKRHIPHMIGVFSR